MYNDQIKVETDPIVRRQLVQCRNSRVNELLLELTAELVRVFDV